MTDLKQKVIENIQKEGALNMDYYGHLPYLLNGDPRDVSCGTACCLAGHIVAAAAQLNLLNVSAEFMSGYNYKDVPNLARKIWGDHYGVNDANRLDFIGGWGNLNEATAEEVVDHINGAAPVYHGSDRRKW